MTNRLYLRANGYKCERCGAPPKQPCHTARGTAAGRPHAARVYKALGVAAARDPNTGARRD